MDRLLQRGHYEEIAKQVYLYGVTLLMLASKYDEIDDNIPFIRNFRAVSSKANFSWDQVTGCETRILNYLNWDLVSLSPENFTTALLSFGIVFSEDNIAF